MYSTCIHCARALGTNDAIEALPIGRRIAFDAQRGRLWVVCHHCERWNLTPFDTRWEAIEQSERAFRDTRVRASTDNIGLARLADGTELVRVGQPQRPEFAAWRYGDQFGRRRVRNIVAGSAIAVGAGAAIAGAASLGVGLVALAPALHVFTVLSAVAGAARPQPRTVLPGGGAFIPFGMPRLIESAHESGWGVDIGYMNRFDASGASLDYPSSWLPSSIAQKKQELGRLQLYGHDALPLLRRVMPRINRAGAQRMVIQSGVQLIEEAGGPEHFAKWAAGKRREWGAKLSFGDTGDLQYIPTAARLAFEMALHEDAEREALAGELASLERAWADAEEIAHIADDLLTPPSIAERLGALKWRT